MTYSKLTADSIERLKGILGDSGVIYGDHDALSMYARDEVSDTTLHHWPEAVVKPTSTEQVSEIMTLANQEGIPVTPRGAGSGLSGGAIPCYGGIVMSFERMNRILEVDRDNLMVVVEPGVVTEEINAAVAKHGLFYAGYPMSVETCFIGGNVAENAGGGRAVKYGVTDRYVMGLEVVVPSGRVIQLGGKRVKDVSGFDLLHLMVGSEGTLGVFTKIILRLIPKPTYRSALLAFFPALDAASRAVRETMHLGVLPSALEIMDSNSFTLASEYLGSDITTGEFGAALIVEVDGNSKKAVTEEMIRAGGACEKCGAATVYVGDHAGTIERIWAIRRAVPEAVSTRYAANSLEDIVVPVSDIGAMARHLERLSEEYGIPVVCYGHAGDGNLHATPVKPDGMSLEEWSDKSERMLGDIYDQVHALGGVISGEHGIGSKRLSYLPRFVDAEVLGLMRAIKNHLDPKWILNPGKVVKPPHTVDEPCRREDLE